MRSFAFLLYLLFGALTGSSGVFADEAKPPSQQELSDLASLVVSDPRFAKYHAMCAVDAFGVEQSFLDSLGFGSGREQSQCRSDLPDCFTTCAAGNGETCFHIARIFEDTDKQPYDGVHSQSVFAFACAAGNHGACTNRGGGMRNGGYENDPVRNWTQQRVDACLFRMFDKACSGDSGWGCTMLGQAYLNGEGVGSDKQKAAGVLRQVCDGPEDDHPSCVYARELLQSLE